MPASAWSRSATFPAALPRSIPAGGSDLHRPIRHFIRGLRVVRGLMGHRGTVGHRALFFADLLPIPPLARRLAGPWTGRRALRRPGQRLADALVELGPSFVKLGQTLAVRPDIMGTEVARDLARLQDRLE